MAERIQVDINYNGYRVEVFFDPSEIQDNPLKFRERIGLAAGTLHDKIFPDYHANMIAWARKELASG